MKIHQYGDRIVVTELKPMSDAPRDGSVFLVLTKLSAEFYQVKFDKAGFLAHYPATHLEFSGQRNIIGWIPMPVYEPASK